MSGVHLLGHAASGHGCYPPTVSASGSASVFVNGTPVVRAGDQIAPHCCVVEPYDCHGGSYFGSHTVFAEGSSVQVLGDPVSCGSTAAQGSSDVFAG